MSTPPSPSPTNSDILHVILARLDDITSENQNLRADVARLSAINTQTATQHRQDVIRNSRASLRMDPSATLTQANLPVPVTGAVGLTPASRFRRRLTDAEVLASPLSPLPAIPDRITSSTASTVNRAAATSEQEEKDPDSPTGAGAAAASTTVTHTVKTAWKTNDKGLALLVKKLDPPPVLSGTPDDKITDVRQWVEAADEYMDMHLGEESEGGRLQLVIQWTTGAPKDWLRAKRREAVALLREGIIEYAVEWKEVKHHFIESMEGPQYRLLQRAELEGLRLGKGKCKTVLYLNSEFDRLAVRLWPSGTDLSTFDYVLGDEYGQIIRRSDLSLWRDIHSGLGIPQTLVEWKAKTAAAWAARLVIAQGQSTASHSYPAQPTRWGGHAARAGVGTTTSERTAVHHVEASDEPSDTWQRQEGEQESASLQQVSAAPHRRGPGSSSGYQLSEEERALLMGAGRCFRCYAKGHRSADASCPGRGKPKRKPTATELGKA